MLEGLRHARPLAVVARSQLLEARSSLPYIFINKILAFSPLLLCHLPLALFPFLFSLSLPTRPGSTRFHPLPPASTALPFLFSLGRSLCHGNGKKSKFSPSARRRDICMESLFSCPFAAFQGSVELRRRAVDERRACLPLADKLASFLSRRVFFAPVIGTCGNGRLVPLSPGTIYRRNRAAFLFRKKVRDTRRNSFNDVRTR